MPIEQRVPIVDDEDYDLADEKGNTGQNGSDLPVPGAAKPGSTGPAVNMFRHGE
jgi:hypothetical protein